MSHRYPGPPRTTRGRPGFNGRMHGRDIPERHRAFAEELAFRDDVEAAWATASGVKVRLPAEVTLPAWLLDKADTVGIGIAIGHDDPPDPPDHERLRSRRQAAGLTQEEVAESLGVHRSLVTDWEQGRKRVRRARAEQIEQVCANAAPAVADGGEP